MAKGRRLSFTASTAGEVRIRVLRCVTPPRKGTCRDSRRVRTLRRQVRPGRAHIDLGKLERGVYLIRVSAATKAATSTRVR
jgi:hypothetical protein